MGFNLEVGGYFSVKRNTMSMDGNTFVRPDQVVAYCKALLEVFRYAPGWLACLAAHTSAADVSCGAVLSAAGYIELSAEDWHAVAAPRHMKV